MRCRRRGRKLWRWLFDTMKNNPYWSAPLGVKFSTSVEKDYMQRMGQKGELNIGRTAPVMAKTNTDTRIDVSIVWLCGLTVILPWGKEKKTWWFYPVIFCKKIHNSPLEQTKLYVHVFTTFCFSAQETDPLIFERKQNAFLVLFCNAVQIRHDDWTGK